jgi:hypothetical protein
MNEISNPMKKSLQDIKELFPIGKNFSLIVNVEDYTFLELLDMAKISGLIGWKFTFKNAAKLSVAELQELLTHADENALTFDFC